MDCFLFFKGQCHMCKVLEIKFYWLKNEVDEKFYQQGQKIRTLEKVCFRLSTYYEPVHEVNYKFLVHFFSHDYFLLEINNFECF